MTYSALDDTGRQVKCRKDHHCEWCNEIINSGDIAVIRKYVWEGDFNSNHQHPECYKAMSESDVGDGFVSGEQYRGWTLDESLEAHWCPNCDKPFKYTDEFKTFQKDLCCSEKCVKELDIFLIKG